MITIRKKDLIGFSLIDTRSKILGGTLMLCFARGKYFGCNVILLFVDNFF